jgi:hypothetical protein
LKKVALGRQDMGALFVMFGFHGFAVAVPWMNDVRPVSNARCGVFFALAMRLKRYR